MATRAGLLRPCTTKTLRDHSKSSSEASATSAPRLSILTE